MWLNLDDYDFYPAYVGVRNAGIKYSLVKSGVYVIKENNTIVYIGMSKSNVWKALYRHFQSWNPDRTGKHYRVCYKNFLNIFHYSVTIIETHPLNTEKIEEELIRYYGPRDNEKFKTVAGHIELQSEYNNKDLPF